MKIFETKDTENKSILHSNAFDSNGSSDPNDAMTTVCEDPTKLTISFFAASKPEQYNLFITAFRILWAKYHYTAEPLTCNIILSRIDPLDSNNKKLFEKSLDFPEILTISSTCEMVFNESKKIFGNLQTIVDQCSNSECHEFNIIALNPDSGKIEIDSTIKINHDIFFSFKAPFESQFSDVILNSEHHILKILNAIQQSPERIIDDILIHDTEELDELIQKRRWLKQSEKVSILNSTRLMFFQIQLSLMVKECGI